MDTSTSNDQSTTVASSLKEDKGFTTFYRSLETVQDSTIRFFDRKGYYSIHGQDAIYVALLHFKTKKALKYWANDLAPTKKKQKLGNSSSSSLDSIATAEEDDEESNNGLAYLTVRDGIEFEGIVQKLFEQKQKVEVWAPKASRVGQWEIIKKGSPGNLQMFEDILNIKDQSLMVALRVSTIEGNRVIGAAFGDSTLKTIGVLQFIDNDHLSNLSSFLLQMGIKECLISVDKKNSVDCKKVMDKLQDSEVPFTEVPNSDFNTKNIEQDLTRLLGSINNVLNEIEKELAMQSLSCLIKHLDLLSNQSYFGKFKLVSFNLDNFMRLDAATFKGLNIISSDPTNKQGMSIFNLLDKCNTPMGSRKLSQWVRQPLVDQEEIETRLNFVEIFVNALELRQALRSNDLKKIGDLERLSKKLVGGKATLEDVVNLYGVVQRLSVLLSSLRSYEDQGSEMVESTFTQPLEQIIAEFQQFSAMVEKTVDLDQAYETHEYVIRSSFSDELSEIHNKKQNCMKKINQLREKIADDLGIDEARVKLHQSDKDGYLVRLSRKDEKLIRGNAKYIVYGTQKDGVRFSTSDIRKLNEAYMSSSVQYNEKQQGLVQRALEITTSFVPLIDDLCSLIATLDVFASLGHVSSSAPSPYVRPIVHPMGKGNITIVGGRHPCVEVQDNVNFISNDIDLTRDKSTFQIITGPNMGGKSTFIRQVGIITLMAQIGCFVPAEQAEISIVDCILTRIGAGDSQLRGVSTFMAEMLETAYILKTATKNSLIIIDELGRGTSTYDGFGLAWGIAEYICHQIGAFCLFATHFHELTVLQEILPLTVKNLHVQANVNDHSGLTLMYKVKEGACDQSFGIHVAIMAGFPDQVVQVARLKAKELESFESNSLASLDSVSQFIQDFKSLDMQQQDQDKVFNLVNNLLSKYQLNLD
ncbi:mutS like protein [Cavenderia fasciculata]|uniref:DNA mismatch repair protein MSH2 n=1 Tax=Cavenderia fasciculata TaxID=261658 RepID=F4Q060_CACFS|nr:mutS like protein [Cavenderia fasciculata]EGG18740.1 mutS like protein [Cavenderia fasciculata]|eukprot:XP_004357202.1 mutS like protein [Cavenderia fasciculata]